MLQEDNALISGERPDDPRLGPLREEMLREDSRMGWS